MTAGFIMVKALKRLLTPGTYKDMLVSNEIINRALKFIFSCQRIADSSGLKAITSRI